MNSYELQVLSLEWQSAQGCSRGIWACARWQVLVHTVIGAVPRSSQPYRDERVLGKRPSQVTHSSLYRTLPG
jgi:hypothetical protein